MLSALLTLFVAGLIGIVLTIAVLAVVGIVFSIAFGIVGFLLFKVVPLLLIGWLILKLVQRSGTRRAISPADEKWLDS